jgi:hypothetical protein
MLAAFCRVCQWSWQLTQMGAKVGNKVIRAPLPRPIGCESENSQGTLRNVMILQAGRRLCDHEFFIDSIKVCSWLNVSLQASIDASFETDDSSFVSDR